MKVKTDYTGCSYITAGKWYSYDKSDYGSGYIVSDSGDIEFILLEEGQCAHLNGEGSWSIVE